MELPEFQRYLSERMPITGPSGMGFRVVRFDDDKVAIRAPLAANINDKNTAFGGSISSLLTITAWAMVVRLLSATEQTMPHVLIQKCSIEYLIPIEGDFEAIALRPDGASASRFLGMMRQFGKARIAVRSTISIQDQEAALFEGSFVGFRQPG